MAASDYDRRTLLSGQFLPRLRVAYAERVVETVRKRLHGSVHRVSHRQNYGIARAL